MTCFINDLEVYAVENSEGERETWEREREIQKRGREKEWGERDRK